MQVTAIKTSAQNYFPETLDASKLDWFIATAVREYSRWNPVVATTNITTVDDQQAYTVTGAIGIIDCYWYPGADANELENLQLYNTLWADTPPMRQVSLPVIQDIVKNSHTDRTKGRWEWRDSKLWLYPEPESDANVVAVRYSAEHELADGAYATIPDEDFDIIVKLTLAEAWRARLMEQLMYGKHATGVVKQEYNVEQTRALIRELQSSVEKYGGSVVVGG